MSWLYSRALVEAYWEANCSDGDVSVPSKTNPMPRAYLSPDRMTDFSRLSRFGMTFEPLTEDLGEGLLTWFLAGFPARTSVLPGKAPASRESTPGCGWKWPASLAKYDPDSCSWKTRQHSLLGGLTEYSETWPPWGTMRDGECWERITLAPRTSGTESGLWQTPVAYDSVNRAKGKFNSRGEPKLSAQVLRPTPSVCGNNNKKGASATSGNGLATTVRMYPTPCARDYRGQHAPDSEAFLKRQEHTRGVPLTEAIQRQGQIGQLNPVWVEWLMGWPINWTDIKSIDIIDIILWEIIHGQTEGKVERKHMRTLWWENDPATMEKWEIRLNVQEQTFLLKRMHETLSLKKSISGKRCGKEKGSTSIQSETLRELREQQVSASSQGSKPFEQFAGEYTFLVSELSCYGAYTSWRLGESKDTEGKNLSDMQNPISAKEGKRQAMQEIIVLERMGKAISRIAVGVDNRVSRLKAIGNGQVPQCMAEAWRILSEK